MKGSKNIIMVVLGVLIIVIGIFLVYFNISYSPLKNNFNSDFKVLDTEAKKKNEYFTKEDFSDFPNPIVKYMENNGFIGKEKMDYAYMEYKNVDFAQSPKRKLKIDYSQYNFAHRPNRIALVESSIFGIPFEGYDYYIDGRGGMHGMLGKMLTLFHQKGDKMDQGALCTYLSESLFVPSSILYNKNISFEEIDPFNVKASITDNGVTVSGVFTFNENYEMTRFYTEDRPAIKDDGSVDYIPWSANILSYKKYDQGINFIDHVQIIWHYPEGDFVYFDGSIDKLIFK